MFDMTIRGIELAAFGMGSVLFFLILLILVTHLMSWLVLRSEHIRDRADVHDQLTTAASPGIENKFNELKLKAIITVAINRYKKDKGAK